MTVPHAGQDPIIKLMKALGYTSNEEGVCFGIASMALQAALVNDMTTLNKRLDFIYSHTTEELVKLINEAKEEQKKARSLPSRPEADAKRRIILDILPFLEGIEIYHQPYQYNKLFRKPAHGQNVRKSSKLVKPSILDDKVKIIEPRTFTGVYTEKELKSYFSSLHESFKGCNLPVTIELSSGNHTMAIVYDPNSGAWSFIDANHKPVVTSLTNDNFVNDMTDHIKSGFYFGEFNGYAIFKTAFRTLSTNADELVPYIDNWKSRSEMKSMLNVDEIKSKAKDSWGSSWITVAADNNETDKVKELLSAKANPNEVFDYYGATSLHIAASHNYKEIAEVILATGKADLNIRDVFRRTAFYIATRFNNIDIAISLIEKGAYLNVPNKKNIYPLDNINDERLLSAINKAIQAKLKELEQAIYSYNDTKCEIILRWLANSLPVEQLNAEVCPNITLLKAAALIGNADIMKSLLHNGADPNKADNNNVTPLHIAAHKGNIQCADILVQAGANPGLTDIKGNSPLTLLEQAGMTNEAKRLDNNAQINQLKKFIKEGNQEEISRMTVELAQSLPKSRLNEEITKGATLLHIAVELNNTALVKKLLDNGANPNCVLGNTGITPLHKAVNAGATAIVDALLGGGANPFLLDNKNITPLMLATNKGYTDIAEKMASIFQTRLIALQEAFDRKDHETVGRLILPLVEAGTRAQLDSARIRGDSLTCIALIYNRKDAIEAILSKGVDPDIANYNGVTTLHIAAHRGMTEAVPLLLKYGANPAAIDVNNKSPLDLALENGRDEMARDMQNHLDIQLLKKQFDDGNADECLKTMERLAPKLTADTVNQLISKDVTMLMLVVDLKRIDLISELLKKGANPNICNSNGATALHFATAANFTEGIKTLLQGGADPGIIDKFNKSPLMLARKNGATEISASMERILAERNSNKTAQTTSPIKKISYSRSTASLSIFDSDTRSTTSTPAVTLEAGKIGPASKKEPS